MTGGVSPDKVRRCSLVINPAFYSLVPEVHIALSTSAETQLSTWVEET